MPQGAALPLGSFATANTNNKVYIFVLTEARIDVKNATRSETESANARRGSEIGNARGSANASGRGEWLAVSI